MRRRGQINNQDGARRASKTSRSMRGQLQHQQDTRLWALCGLPCRTNRRSSSHINASWSRFARTILSPTSRPIERLKSMTSLKAFVYTITQTVTWDKHTSSPRLAIHGCHQMSQPTMLFTLEKYPSRSCESWPPHRQGCLVKKSSFIEWIWHGPSTRVLQVQRGVVAESRLRAVKPRPPDYRAGIPTT
jgi:hypothetical protein